MYVTNKVDRFKFKGAMTQWPVHKQTRMSVPFIRDQTSGYKRSDVETKIFYSVKTKFDCIV